MEATTGHNKPPNMADTASEVARSLSDWMAEAPVISSVEMAKEAKILVDRAKLCIRDLEDERGKYVKPLNEQVKLINDLYRQPRTILERVLSELERRVSQYLSNEERKRIEAAAEAARLAAEAERLARDAEHAEREAMQSANQGELGIGIDEKVAEADRRFADYGIAARQAARAEKETKVKISGGFSRAISLRSEEILTVADPVAVLVAIMIKIPLTEGLREALKTAARIYKKAYGAYPPGIEVKTERKV